jgi:hypothetical protein
MVKGLHAMRRACIELCTAFRRPSAGPPCSCALFHDIAASSSCQAVRLYRQQL